MTIRWQSYVTEGSDSQSITFPTLLVPSLGSFTHLPPACMYFYVFFFSFSDIFRCFIHVSRICSWLSEMQCILCLSLPTVKWGNQDIFKGSSLVKGCFCVLNSGTSILSCFQAGQLPWLLDRVIKVSGQGRGYAHPWKHLTYHLSNMNSLIMPTSYRQWCAEGSGADVLMYERNMTSMDSKYVSFMEDSLSF